MTIELNWNPVPYLGPIPINWYGLNFALAFLVGAWLTLRRAPQFGLDRDKVEGLLFWILVGSTLGARLYFVLQNDPGEYFRQPWRVLAVWEGGLAFFGGLVGATFAGFLFCRRATVPFARAADLFAPQIAIGGAIGRVSCGLAGMDFGTPTSLPWGVIYTNPNSYGPTYGLPRHPVQFYELLGDLLIASVLLRLRRKLPEGGLFVLYLAFFSTLRFLLFLVRGDVPPVALGLKNGQWTALAILITAAAFAVFQWIAPMIGRRLAGAR